MDVSDGRSGSSAAWAPWSAGAAFLVGEAGGYLLPLVVGPMTRTYPLSESAAGLVVALQLGAFSIAAIALAPRLGQLSQRRTALIAVALIMAGNLLSAAHVSIATLLTGRVLTGLGEGTAEAVGAAMIARQLNPERAFARVFVAVILMSLSLYLILPSLVAGMGARPLFVGLGIAPLLAVPLLLQLPAGRAHRSIATSSLGAAAVPVPARPALPALAVCVALMLYSISANAAWFYLERIANHVGMDAATYGRLVSIAGVIALAGPLLAQWLGLRAGRAAPLIAACLVVGGGGWLVTHSGAPLPFTAGVASSSAALLFGVPYFMGLAAQLDQFGSIAAAARGFNGIGSTLAPAVAGGVLMASGSYRGIGWASVIAAALSLLLVLAVIAATRRALQAPARPTVRAAEHDRPLR